MSPNDEYISSNRIVTKMDAKPFVITLNLDNGQERSFWRRLLLQVSRDLFHGQHLLL